MKAAIDQEVHLKKILSQANFDLPPSQIHDLVAFYRLLLRANEDQSLTRITDFEAAAVKHFIDSLMPLKFIALPKKLLDIGTGAGFPGIPLKIVRPDVEVILAEHRPKRVAFLKAVVKELGLAKIGIFPRKVTPESFHAEVDGVITRAVEDMAKTLIRIERFLVPGGLAIFLKGPTANEECEVVAEDPELKDLYCLHLDQRYELPILNHERRLIVYERIDPDRI